MGPEYTVDYFIAKFEAIADDKWIVGDFEDGRGGYCALGHCGSPTRETAEAGALEAMFFRRLGCTVVDINDAEPAGIVEKYGHTPKERILNALREIKSRGGE